jgi:hypothetical protein
MAKMLSIAKENIQALLPTRRCDDDDDDGQSMRRGEGRGEHARRHKQAQIMVGYIEHSTQKDEYDD